jgi:hypothetical protein
MAPSDQKTEVVTPAEVPEDLPLPSDPKVIFLGGLFVLAVLPAAYVVSEIVLPLVFAIVNQIVAGGQVALMQINHVGYRTIVKKLSKTLPALRAWLPGKLEYRYYSHQLGSYLGNVSLSPTVTSIASRSSTPYQQRG